MVLTLVKEKIPQNLADSLLCKGRGPHVENTTCSSTWEEN